MTNLPDNGPPTAYSNTPNCLICGEPLDLRQTQGRRSRKPSLMFVCPVDGRHFRAFVTYRPYVDAVLARLDAPIALSTNEGDTDDDESSTDSSEATLGQLASP